MALPRNTAYALFDDLIAAGHDAYLHGRGNGAYFVTAHTEHLQRAGVAAETIAALAAIGEKYGLTAWLTTHEADGDDGEPSMYAAVVRFS